LHRHFNATSRAETQRLEGSKRVAFAEPDKQRMALRVGAVDPTKRALQDRDWEEQFHREASKVIEGRSQSAPDLRGTWSLGTTPKARSKHMLDPTLWRTEPLLAQTCMISSPGNYLGRRFARAPGEADGVEAAGKRTTRWGSHGVTHNDTGLLQAAGAPVGGGEAAHYKTWHGASCGAPAQDHYTYAVGRSVTDAEFPLGKRIIPKYP